MDKMVEDRFRVAVKAVGDAWYTAWIDAGQPVPPEKQNKIELPGALVDEIKENKQGKLKVREHE